MREKWLINDENRLTDSDASSWHTVCMLFTEFFAVCVSPDERAVTISPFSDKVIVHRVVSSFHAVHHVLESSRSYFIIILHEKSVKNLPKTWKSGFSTKNREISIFLINYRVIVLFSSVYLSNDHISAVFIDFLQKFER